MAELKPAYTTGKGINIKLNLWYTFVAAFAWKLQILTADVLHGSANTVKYILMSIS